MDDKVTERERKERDLGGCKTPEIKYMRKRHYMRMDDSMLCYTRDDS